MASFADLEKCIQANISAQNNDIRTQAENYLKELKKKHPQQFFEGISELIMKSNDSSVRSFSAVLLKHNLRIFDETFFKLNVNSQNNIKTLLLKCIENEKNPNVTKQIAEAVSYLTCLILQNSENNNNNKWNELMPFLLSLLQTKDDNKKVSFYICIEKLACNCIDILRNSNGNGNSMEKLKDILINGLQDKKDIICEYALSSVVCILCSLNEENELLYFSNIIPLLFKHINNSKNDVIICKTCEKICYLVENICVPNFFISSINPIIECLVNVTKSSNLEWETRRLSMHLLITLLNFNCNQMIQNNKNNNLSSIGNKIIPLVFDFLATFNENLEWNTPTDDVEQTNYIFGCEILPIIVSIFGAEIFLSIIQKPIFDIGFSDNCSWKKKLIALKTVEVTLEGCVEYYENKLLNIVNSIIKSVSNNNNNPYIKYNALLLIKQLSVIFGEDKQIFLIPYHNKLIISFINMLNNSQNEHICVLIALCEAIAHFVYIDDDCTDDEEENQIILNYSPKLLNGLYNLLKNNNNNLIQIHTLKAISVIISVIQENFNKEMYKILINFCVALLQKIFNNNTKDKTGELRGRCMECIGQMLVVTEIDICRNDAHNIMKYLLPFQKQEQNNSSESYTYMLSLFASCAEALSNEFTPYLQHVIPSLLQSAQKQSIYINNNNNNNNDNIITDEFGGIKMQVNTAEYNERSTAVKQFPRYAVCMEGELLQFVKPIANVLKPIISKRCTLSSVARRYAIETFYPLVNCLKLGLKKKQLENEEINKWITQFTEELLDSLIDGMNISDEVDEFSLICKTIQSLFNDYIDNKLFKNVSIISDITEQISTAIQERQERKKINEQKSIDLIDEQVEIDVEADLADTIVDLISNITSKFGEKYIQIFDKFCGKQCINLLNGNEDDQILSLSMLTEIIKYSGNNSNKYIQYILKISQKYLISDTQTSSPLLQSISYAIGCIAIKKGLNTSNLSKWINLLQNNIINKQNSHNDDNITATENAISAIGKICKSYENSNQNNNKFIIQWINLLPIINDNEEREFCNSYLLSILKNTSLLKGIIESNNSQMIDKLINIIAVAIVKNDKQEKEFKQLFLHIKSKCNENIVKQSINNLSNNLQSAFAQ